MNSQVKAQTKHRTNKQKASAYLSFPKRLEEYVGQDSSPDLKLPDYDLFAMSLQQAPWCFRFGSHISVDVACQVCSEIKPSNQLASLGTQLEKFPNSSQVIKFVPGKWTNSHTLKFFLAKHWRVDLEPPVCSTCTYVFLFIVALVQDIISII